MNSIGEPKKRDDYMVFLSQLPKVQSLLAEQKALKKEVQKKRRRLKTIITKYNFINEIVAIGATDTALSLSIKRALKGVGFKDVHHLDKQKREDIKLTHQNSIMLFEINGVTGGAKRTKGFQIIVNTLVARKNATDKIHGCLIINHNNNKPFQERTPNPFKDKYMNTDVKAGEVSLITTVTLRLMLIDIIKGSLTLEKFIDLLSIAGDVKYSPS